MRVNNQGGSRLPSSSLGLSVDIANMFRQAIRYCAEKLKIEPEEAVELVCQDDKSANSYLRYALAKQLCGYLGGLGDTFKSIYIHGSAVKGISGSTSDIDMILLVNKKVDELAILLAKLNLLISKYYQLVMGEKTRGMQEMLDIKIIDEKDVFYRRGYGSVVTSIHVSPIKIWSEQKSFSEDQYTD